MEQFSKELQGLTGAAVRGEAVADERLEKGYGGRAPVASTEPTSTCPAWKRPIMYTDTLDGKQTCRDDLWAITTGELTALTSPRAADALDRQPNVLAYVATDLDGRADVGMTREKAMERAGHGCDTIIPVYDLGATQPIVAAQQGSIGDDVQNVADDPKFVTIMGGMKKSKGSYEALIAYIDSRAPAAQAASVTPVAPLALDEGVKLIRELVDMADIAETYASGAQVSDEFDSLRDRMVRFLAQQEGSEAGNG